MQQQVSRQASTHLVYETNTTHNTTKHLVAVPQVPYDCTHNTDSDSEALTADSSVAM